MSYTDALWHERNELIYGMLESSNQADFNRLMLQFVESVGEYLSLFKTNPMESRNLVQEAFCLLLEESGVLDSHFKSDDQKIDSLVHLFAMSPALKQYCEEMYLNDGLMGALRYGELPTVGHEIVHAALQR